MLETILILNIILIFITVGILLYLVKYGKDFHKSEYYHKESHKILQTMSDYIKKQKPLDDQIKSIAKYTNDYIIKSKKLLHKYMDVEKDVDDLQRYVTELNNVKNQKSDTYRLVKDLPLTIKDFNPLKLNLSKNGVVYYQINVDLENNVDERWVIGVRKGPGGKITAKPPFNLNRCIIDLLLEKDGKPE